jgi:WD40 repeat protein
MGRPLSVNDRATLLLADTQWEYAFYPSDLAWAPDGKTLLVCGVMVDVENSPGPSESSLATWVVSASGDHLRDEPRCEGSRLDFSPDGSQVAVGRPVRVVPVEPGEERNLGKGGARCLAWSPDGQVLAVDRDDEVVILDPAQGREIALLEGGEQPIQLTWSPDGKRLAVGFRKGPIRVFDLAGQALKTLEAVTGMVRWSPTSDRLAVLEPDRRGISLLDAESWALVRAIRGHAGLIACMCWSPDGLRLATGSGDRTVRVWSAETGHQVLRLDDVDSQQLAWSPDGTVLAALCTKSGKYSSRLRLWDMPAADEPGSPRWEQSAGVAGVRWLQTGPVDQVTFAGPHLITAHALALRSWDLETDQERWARQSESSPLTLACADDERLFLEAGGRVQVIRAGDGTDLGAIERLAHADDPHYYLSSAGVFADGSLLYTVVATRELSVLQIWDLERGEEIWGIGTTESYRVASCGERLAVSTYSKLHVVVGRESHILWSAEVDFPWGLAFSPHDQALALIHSGTLTLYAEDGNPRWCEEHDYDSANLIAWSPDGRLLAWTADWGKVVWIHDAQTGAPVGALEGHTAEIAALRWSPRSDLLASASRDQSVRLFTPKGHLVKRVEYPEDFPKALAWSPDGKILTSTDAGGALLVCSSEHHGV